MSVFSHVASALGILSFIETNPGKGVYQYPSNITFNICCIQAPQKIHRCCVSKPCKHVQLGCEILRQGIGELVKGCV